MLETKLLRKEKITESIITSSCALFESIKIFMKLANMCWIFLVLETWRLMDKHGLI